MPSILGKLNVEKRDARTRYTTRAFEGTLEMSSGKNVDCVTGNENKLVASSRPVREFHSFHFPWRLRLSVDLTSF